MLGKRLFGNTTVSSVRRGNASLPPTEGWQAVHSIAPGFAVAGAVALPTSLYALPVRLPGSTGPRPSSNGWSKAGSGRCA